MLKGLAVRQGLIALNGALAVVFAVIVLMMGREVLRGQFAAGPVSNPDLSSVSAPALSGPARSATDYDALMARGLFGEAGRYERNAKAAEAPAAPPPTETQETSLPLTLFGTSVSLGKEQLSAAIIEVRDGGTKTATFYPNDQVMDQVILKEVRRQEVILENRRTNTTESLRINWAASPVRPTPSIASRVSAAQPIAANAGARVDLVQLDREAITKKMEDEYARVSATLNVKVVNDENGKTKGITTDNIENFETAKDLGFKNGDVLVSLNNEPVDSKDKAVEVLKKYRNASLFRVGLLRDGQMMYKTFRVK